MTKTGGDDRISCLPDDMLHRIMSFLDIDDVIRTSVLSTRWKCVWTTLPFLNFELVPGVPKDVIARTVKQIFSTRNHMSQLLKLKLIVDDVFTNQSLEQFVRYAVNHGVEDLNVKSVYCKSSIFTSVSLRKLTLAIDFDKPYFKFLNRWDLPVLHTLHLEHYFHLQCYRRIPIEFLTCLPALISLTIVRVSLPKSLDLPLLQTLILLDSDLPERIWNLPCLNTLEVTDIRFPSDLGNFLAALVHLENLRLISTIPGFKDCVISSARLINLELNTTVMAAAFNTPHILVLSSDISNISIRGVFFVTCGVSELETVSVDLQDCILDKAYVPGEMLKQFYCRILQMLSGLGGAKILKIDLDTLEALSTVSNYLEHLSSPFHNLNCVKLPQGCKESNMSTALRNYILGGTPGATIVTAVPQNPENHLTVSQTSQKVTVDEPSATSEKKLIFHGALKKVCSDTVEKRVEVQNMVKNSVVDAGSMRQACASDAGTGTNQASSSRGNTDIMEWQGHKAVPVSTSIQMAIQDDPFGNLTKELDDFQDLHKKVCSDTVEKTVEVENVRQAGAAGIGSDEASSSMTSTDKMTDDN